jgi:hypothetical protein
MIKNFINEEAVFEVNPEYELSVIELEPERARIAVVDNFYKNPDLVRDLALTIPPSVNERILNNLPYGADSGRINAFYIMDHLGPAYDQIIKQVWPEIHQQYEQDYFLESFKRATFMVNVMTSNNLPPRLPHVDSDDKRFFASAIYLNTPAECAGGTAFYTFGDKLYASDIDVPARTVDVDGTQPSNHFTVDNCGDWKRVGMVDMKYNRMIIYSQNIFHSAYIKPEMFVDGIYRLNQQFFI